MALGVAVFVIIWMWASAISGADGNFGFALEIGWRDRKSAGLFDLGWYTMFEQ